MHLKKGLNSINLTSLFFKMQKEKFNPMQHIINQQERYLDMSLDFNIKDSW